MRTYFLAAVSLVAASASADIRVHGVSTSRWGLLGAQVGVGGATIENFEDANLAPGLQVAVTTGNGSYGPTSTLPNAFDTRVDPFGTAFQNMQWEGNGALINTRTNQPLFYNDGNNWGDVEFRFSPAVKLVAFSVAQRDVAARLIINGVDRGELGELSGVPTSSGRGGYVVIDATGSDTITSVKIDNNGGDGIVFDYLAFSTEPLPAVSVSGVAPSQWGASNSVIGMQGALIEEFDDATLVPRLKVEWDCPAGHVGPTNTLPSLFNPVVNDPFGDAFDTGTWEGARCLVTGFSNQSWNYTDGSHWGDIVLHFDPPAFVVGFSLQQADNDGRMIVNGRDIGSIASLTGLPINGVRQGYVKVFAGDAIISSIRLANNRVNGFGDGYAIDHVGMRGCGGDFNGDGFTDGFDYDDFVACFEGDPCPPGQSADFNGDGFADGFDYDDFVSAFENTCP